MQATRLCVTLEQIHRQSTINGLFWEPTNTEFLIADLEHRIYHLRPTPKPVVLYQHQPKTLAKDLPAPASVEEEPAVEYLLDEPEYRSDSEGEYDYPDWED